MRILLTQYQPSDVNGPNESRSRLAAPMSKPNGLAVLHYSGLCLRVFSVSPLLLRSLTWLYSIFITIFTSGVSVNGDDDFQFHKQTALQSNFLLNDLDFALPNCPLLAFRLAYQLCSCRNLHFLDRPPGSD